MQVEHPPVLTSSSSTSSCSCSHRSASMSDWSCGSDRAYALLLAPLPRPPLVYSSTRPVGRWYTPQKRSPERDNTVSSTHRQPSGGWRFGSYISCGPQQQLQCPFGHMALPACHAVGQLSHLAACTPKAASAAAWGYMLWPVELFVGACAYTPCAESKHLRACTPKMNCLSYSMGLCCGLCVDKNPCVQASLTAAYRPCDRVALQSKLLLQLLNYFKPIHGRSIHLVHIRCTHRTPQHSTIVKQTTVESSVHVFVAKRTRQGTALAAVTADNPCPGYPCVLTQTLVHSTAQHSAWHPDPILLLLLLSVLPSSRWL